VSSARGRNPEDGFQYIITGVTNGTYARLLLDMATPLAYGVEPMWKQSVEVTERKGTYSIFDGVVKYGAVKLPDAGDWTWGWDCTVETEHVTYALEHIADYAKSGVTAKNYKGAIGANASGDIEGVDKFFPKFEWWEKHTIAYRNAQAAWALSLVLASSGGLTNLYTFRNFPPNTVLFLGGTGERSNTRPSLFEITVRFRGGVNRTNFSIGDITGVAKKAWEYVWVNSAAEVPTAAGGLVHVPTCAHTERLYDAIDYSALGINMGPPTY
jgi:hypothetical protein